MPRVDANPTTTLADDVKLADRSVLRSLIALGIVRHEVSDALLPHSITGHANSANGSWGELRAPRRRASVTESQRKRRYASIATMSLRAQRQRRPIVACITSIAGLDSTKVRR
jgi:hypothetical protein